jgi:hypothetical protein
LRNKDVKCALQWTWNNLCNLFSLSCHKIWFLQFRLMA